MQNIIFRVNIEMDVTISSVFAEYIPVKLLLFKLKKYYESEELV